MFYPLVSVIIPVYQAEKFLTECVESVRKQDYSELEIVLVNDGSTDRSNQMCEELAAADPRIRVIHQNNKGSGAARNAGIKEATGKYLLFLDADDKLDDSSAIRSLAARAEREQADIVIGTYRRWRANGEKVKCCSNLEKENPELVKTITKQTAKCICINDSNFEIPYEHVKRELNDAFSKLFPQKSQFEK